MKELWIGLVSVRSQEGSDLLKGCLGAYVQAVGFAESESTFIEIVRSAIGDLKLIYESIEEIEPLDSRLSRTSVDPELLKEAHQVNDAVPVIFGTFHTYNSDLDMN
jgi:hypothetical protein